MMKLTKILIIDDTKSILDVLKDVFEFEDFKVYIETNSQLGIDSAKNNIPDLIICDVMMPIKNGYEVHEELKKNSATQSIPFLFLTADINIKANSDSFGINPVDYILKPFSLEDLLEAARKKLKN
jgi:two-component system sensor kinase